MPSEWREDIIDAQDLPHEIRDEIADLVSSYLNEQGIDVGALAYSLEVFYEKLEKTNAD